jgi:hypothetical protein
MHNFWGGLFSMWTKQFPTFLLSLSISSEELLFDLDSLPLPLNATPKAIALVIDNEFPDYTRPTGMIGQVFIEFLCDFPQLR